MTLPAEGGARRLEYFPAKGGVMHGNPAQGKNFIRYLNILLGAVIIIVATLFLLRVVSDPDFFWHLKTGEWIWQNKALPSDDPFSYTSPSTVSVKARIILTSYWLCQLLYHALHSAAGMYGIVLLRFAIFSALLYALFKRKHGDRTLFLGVLLISITCFFLIYPPDRPQVFSFLFFGVLLLLLDRIKDGERGGYYELPLLMLAWGNMHGGYILGQAIIITSLAMEGVKFLRPALLNPMARDAYRKLLLAGAGGIACSFVNPSSSYQLWFSMAETPSYMLSYSNIEYQSSIATFLRNNDNSFFLYWSLLLLTGFGLLVNLRDIRKLDITQVVILAATGYFSFTQIRYIAFFLIAAAPAASRLLSEGAVLRWARPPILVLALSLCLFLSRSEISNVKNVVANSWVNEYLFPVRAAEFIVSNNLAGNMYNHFTWGGYLIWRLGPERKVFVDGRCLYEHVYAQSQLVDVAHAVSVAGMPFWKSVLAYYRVQYVITPFYNTNTGMMMPLVKALMRDREWVPVFIYFDSVIFVKDTPDNSRIISAAQSSVKKRYFGESMLYMLSMLIKERPDSVPFHIAKGDVYADMYRFKEAREEYEQVLRLAPYNTTAKQKLGELDAWGK